MNGTVWRIVKRTMSRDFLEIIFFYLFIYLFILFSASFLSLISGVSSLSIFFGFKLIASVVDIGEQFVCTELQRTNTDNSKQIFPKKELRGHSTNVHIHVYVSELYIYSHNRSAYSWNMWTHGVRWINLTYVARALSSLLATCVVFWSHRRRVVEYTAVMSSPERMYITLDSSACTSYPSLKRRFGKTTGLQELSSFLLSQ